MMRLFRNLTRVLGFAAIVSLSSCGGGGGLAPSIDDLLNRPISFTHSSGTNTVYLQAGSVYSGTFSNATVGGSYIYTDSTDSATVTLTQTTPATGYTYAYTMTFTTEASGTFVMTYTAVGGNPTTDTGSFLITGL